jgi:PilZ domain
MNATAEKRAHERHRYVADIAFSHFNKERSYHAHTLNVGMGGMCFESELYLQPGATICVRLIKTHPDDFCNGFCEGLRFVTLAE